MDTFQRSDYSRNSFTYHSMTAKIIKTAIRRFLRLRGYHVYAASHLPLGFNWMLDVERLAKPDAIKSIFDVGANVGQTAILLSRRFPQAKIYSFEPLSATFHKLQQNTAALKNVTCENCALGSESKMIDLHPKSSSMHNSPAEHWRATGEDTNSHCRQDVAFKDD
jgi:hypothetical protein